MASRDQALSLLTAAGNHTDLTVKLSSLKQAKDILLSMEPSLAAELFPYLADLQYAPDSLVRKMLIQIIQEIGSKTMDQCSVLIHVLLAVLRDSDPLVVRQSIVTATNLFCAVLEEIASQFHGRKKMERWLEELWILMLKLKDSILAIALEPGSVGTKLLALKFLETYVLLFTPDINDSEKNVAEGTRRLFNISWVGGGFPLMDPAALMSDANRTLGILLDFLGSSGSLPGSLTIAVVNCIAAIARKRPLHYATVFSALLDFDPNFETSRGGHTASIQYSVRTAFLGFLRCTYPPILESRDRLIRALRSMNAGDAADQVIRQVDKIIRNNERASREVRFSRDDQLPSQLPFPGDQLRKRSVTMDNGEPVNGHEVAPKRIRHGSSNPSSLPVQINDSDQNLVNGVSANVSLLDNDPAEQMIAMIGALLAAGERGSKSLEVLISTMHPDMLADIVITNMKHLPKFPPPLTKIGNSPVMHQISSLSGQSQVMPPSAPSDAVSPVSSAQLAVSAVIANSTSVSDSSTINNLPGDTKRDPRRDPRRLDPRRIPSSTGVPSVPIDDDDTGPVQPEFDGSVSLSKPPPSPVMTSIENPPAPLILSNRNDDKSLESPLVSEMDQVNPREELPSGPEEIIIPSPLEFNTSSDHALSPQNTVVEEPFASKLFDVELASGPDTSFVMEPDQLSPSVSNSSAPEEICDDLPQLPLYVQLSEEQLETERKLAVERIIGSYQQLSETDGSRMRMALLARLVAQIDADDIVVMLQKHIVVDYRQQKGHELVLHILYHLHSLMILDSAGDTPYAAVIYEKFLLVVVKSLLETFPASDKSFSRLLGEVPVLPESCLKLLDDLCHSDVLDAHGKEVRDGERVTQGLGAVWGLILGRPSNRQVCLDIALKCAVHSQDDIRAKAIRLVANKLYQLNYISGNIEQFATNMLLSAVDKPISDAEFSQSVLTDQREGEVGSQEPSVSGSQVSESGNGDNVASRDTQAAAQSFSTISFPEAQRLISLFFALCTKKHSLLQVVFDIYGRAPKTVKQAVHRHTPVLIRALGSSYSELLRIISDPPERCENLLMLVLQILTQETSPSADLIATVRHLYETKLKDATILIPILSSLSKNEVLPIFPRLVGLPIEKFQMALAHILQGSAHTGPALTPAEVLVAIHDIIPDKDGIARKKIQDACSACFDQRTVFTQQVLAKALNQMVDQTPLPQLFMRTVIQAIDAFPSLVDFVMEILSKLVSRQVWKIPVLWVGFLKCASQTRPHSFHVLLQLPPPQLEIALNKYANLRGPLASYASQPNMKTSLPRSTLAVLGLVNESHGQQTRSISSLHPSSDASSSAHGATLT